MLVFLEVPYLHLPLFRFIVLRLFSLANALFSTIHHASANISHDHIFLCASFTFDLERNFIWGSTNHDYSNVSEVSLFSVPVKRLPHSPQLSFDSTSVRPMGTLSLRGFPIYSFLLVFLCFITGLVLCAK